MATDLQCAGRGWHDRPVPKLIVRYQPRRTTAILGRRQTCTRLRRLTLSRAAPVVCIQVAKLKPAGSRVTNPATPTRKYSPISDLAEGPSCSFGWPASVVGALVVVTR